MATTSSQGEGSSHRRASCFRLERRSVRGAKTQCQTQIKRLLGTRGLSIVLAANPTRRVKKKKGDGREKKADARSLLAEACGKIVLRQRWRRQLERGKHANTAFPHFSSARQTFLPNVLFATIDRLLLRSRSIWMENELLSSSRHKLYVALVVFRG